MGIGRFIIRMLTYVFCLSLLLVGIESCSPAPVYKTGKSSAVSRARSKSTTRSKSKVRNDDSEKTGLKKVQYGISSYYGKDFHGKLTANGEIYDMYGISAAHKYLPLGTVVRVTNIDNSKSIVLRINDRGPYIAGRILDCSVGAAQKLGFIDKGTANIKLVVIELGDNAYKKN